MTVPGTVPLFLYACHGICTVATAFVRLPRHFACVGDFAVQYRLVPHAHKNVAKIHIMTAVSLLDCIVVTIALNHFFPLPVPSRCA